MGYTALPMVMRVKYLQKIIMRCTSAEEPVPIPRMRRSPSPSSVAGLPEDDPLREELAPIERPMSPKCECTGLLLILCTLLQELLALAWRLIRTRV